ncbi:sensor histidine kinase [Herbiconiux sp. CPCC 205763]|uniref:histidine kinase n=1 Tax=Herbiconiux aconitum TaxID=2970913 RepID=A0ABT2GVE7_9MICO|nr:sensor histidine kinase [Herbiconiux aconitum]MCS5718861.1 sensor histidine kinase [Herbiconiux aconitum]
MPHPGRSNDDRGDERARENHPLDERRGWTRERWAGADDRRRMHERWAEGGGEWPRFRFSGWARLWVPVILSFIVQVPAAVFTWRFRQAPQFADDDPVRFAARIGLALLGPVALIAARRFPGPVVAVVSAAAGAYALLVAGEFAPPYIALAFAIVSAVVRGARLWAWWSLGVAWVLTVTIGILIGADWQPAAVIAVSLGLVLLLAIGERIRSRRARIDELRKRAAERRLTEVQAERVRIARELHDVLAHSLSQINVQAGVGLHLIDTQPELAARALADIKEASKSALDEVRSVLGVLREGQDAPGAVGDESAPLVPEPDLSRIDGLVASVVSQGLAVTLENGIPLGADAAPRTSPPPKAVQLALYRIVQESLTNVVRHANATSAAVVLAETPDAWTVSVVDDGTRHPARDASRGAIAGHPRDQAGTLDGPRPGRGLLGMTERAELLGGHLAAGPRPGGGFAVEAAIPRRATPADRSAPPSTSTLTPPPAAPPTPAPSPPRPTAPTEESP